MALSRYVNSVKIRGIRYGTSEISTIIKKAIDSRTINYSTYVMKEGDRLDTVAGERLGDGGNWWAIAAASGIGWGLQVPPGTLVKIPNMASVIALVVSRAQR